MDIEALKAVCAAATPQAFDTAEQATHHHTGESLITCPTCDGEGSVVLEADYCNYDNRAVGVQFYGVGPTHGAAENFARAFNPLMASKLLRVVEACNHLLTNQQGRLLATVDDDNLVELTVLEDDLDELEAALKSL